MIKSKRKKIDKFLKTLNVVLFSIIFVVGLLFILVASEKEESVELGNAKDLLSKNKESSMRNNEIIENNTVFVKDSYLEEELQETNKVDPDLDYAIKLFETSVNKKIKKQFKKPFNYKEGSYCKTKFDLSKESFRFLECNGDSIYKRELQLAIDKVMPIERFTYNNINLGKKELIVLLSVDN